MRCQTVQAVWVKCASHRDAVLLQFQALTAHLEDYDLSAEISPQDPDSVDIQFRHYVPEVLEELKHFPAVLDVGLIKEPRAFKTPAEIRGLVEDELRRLAHDAQTSNAA